MKEASSDFVVLDNVDVTIKSGEIVGLLGRSGSGKSTPAPHRRGSPASPPPARSSGVAANCSAPPEGVAMVFQSFALFPWLTVQENVELGLEAQGVCPRRARAAGRGGNRPHRPRRLRERLSEGDVGRHAPARRPGPCAGGPSRSLADGRTIFRTRCADRRDIAHRPDRPMDGRQAAGKIGADGDAQHRGSGADVRPHPGILLQSRPCRAGIARALPASAQPARCGLPQIRPTTSTP